MVTRAGAMTTVSCNCGSRFEAATHLAGKQVPCPRCGWLLDIPAPAPQSVVVSCRCGRRFQAPGSLVGRTVSCPGCGDALQVGNAVRPPAPQPIVDYAAARNQASVTSGLGRTVHYDAQGRPATSGDSGATPPWLWVAIGVAAVALIGLVGAIWFTRTPQAEIAAPTGSGRESAGGIAGAGGAPAADSSANTPTYTGPPVAEPTNMAELDAFYTLPIGTKNTANLWISGSEAFGRQKIEHSLGFFLHTLSDLGPSMPLPNEDWRDVKKLRELLSEFDSSFEKLHQAAQAKGAARYSTNFSRGIAMELPQIEDLRAASRALRVRAYVMAHDGRPEEVSKALMSSLALNDSLQAFPVSAVQVMRTGAITRTNLAIVELVPQAGLTDAQLLQLQQALARNDDDGLWRALAVDRVMLLAALADPMKLLREFPEFDPGGSLSRLMPTYPASSLQRDRDTLNNWLTKTADAAKLPWPDRLDAVQELRNEVDQATKLSSEQRPILALILLTPFETIFKAAAFAEASRSAARAAVAVERFRRQHGNLPSSLEEVPYKIMAEMPRDPFDGLALRYEATPKGPKFYSVGTDRKDNLGEDNGKGTPDLAFSNPAHRLAFPREQASSTGKPGGDPFDTNTDPLGLADARTPAKPVELDEKRRMKIYEDYTKHLRFAENFFDSKGEIPGLSEERKKEARMANEQLRKDGEDILRTKKDFLCNWYKISPQQLDAILAEGKARQWKQGGM